MMTQLWPPVEPRTLSRQVWDANTARALPGVGRALSLYSGLIGQMALDQVRGVQPVSPRPRVLEQPDLDIDLVTFIGTSVEDYLMHGNAAALVTARDASGYPAALRYFPAWAWSVVDDRGVKRVYLHGREVAPADVLHVQRGVDELNPFRGVGILEQHVRSLDRVGLQEEYERSTLRESGVPSVAVIAPQKNPSEESMTAAADKWEEKFGGPARRPVILPNGTVVTPLSWSPSDQQLVLARQLSAVDQANIFNLDPYWLGAPGSSHTYRSAGSMFVALLRVSLEPILSPFEEAFSRMLVPRGSRVRFDRTELTRDDMASMVSMGVQAINTGLMTVDEWRGMVGLAPFGTPESTTPRLPSEAPAIEEPAPEPDVHINPPAEGSRS